MDKAEITHKIIGCAFRVHSAKSLLLYEHWKHSSACLGGQMLMFGRRKINGMGELGGLNMIRV